MAVSFYVGLGVLSALTVGCKLMGGSAPSTTSSAGNGQVSVCQLSAGQVAQVAAATEFQSAEKVDPSLLDAGEREAIEQGGETGTCSQSQVSSLAESFPSVASALSAGGGSSAVAGMGSLGDMGMPGVVRTEYITVPKAGSRYLAGYNSDGIMVLLLRLMQHRPR